MTQPLTYVSLFSGVGGFDMGMDSAGWQCVAQVEWDAHCQSILARHWPDVPRWADVCDVSGHELPPADCIIFGSPCQDLSIAGKRAGIAEGTRSGLFFEAVRIIREMREATNGASPRIAVWENVAGALNSNGGADFGIVIDALAEAGALAIEWAVLDAQHFGVPQRRRRVFLVAIFDPGAVEHCPEPLLPVCEGSSRDSSARRQARQDDPRSAADSTGTGGEVAACLNSGGNSGGFRTEPGEHLVVEREIAPCLRSGGDGGVPSSRGEHLVVEQVTTALTTRCGNTQDDQQVGQLVVEPSLSFDSTFSWQSAVYKEVSPTVKVGTGLNIASPPAVLQPIEQAVAFAENERGELRESEVALCLSTSGGKPGSGYSAVRLDHVVRRLTPRECERLMGWPDDHTRWRADGTEQADSHRYRQCGNGVASPVAAWVGKHVAALLRGGIG